MSLHNVLFLFENGTAKYDKNVPFWFWNPFWNQHQTNNHFIFLEQVWTNRSHNESAVKVKLVLEHTHMSIY